MKKHKRILTILAAILIFPVVLLLVLLIIGNLRIATSTLGDVEQVKVFDDVANIQSVSPDSKQVAFFTSQPKPDTNSYNYDVYVFTVASRQAQKIKDDIERIDGATDIIWSSNNRLLFFSGRAALQEEVLLETCIIWNVTPEGDFIEEVSTTEDEEILERCFRGVDNRERRVGPSEKVYSPAGGNYFTIEKHEYPFFSLQWAKACNPVGGPVLECSNYYVLVVREAETDRFIGRYVLPVLRDFIFWDADSSGIFFGTESSNAASYLLKLNLDQ